MKKIIYLLSMVVVFFIGTTMSAQDKIFLKSGDNIEVKILEINVNDVKYKKFTHQEGPTYTVLKSDVHMILYKNGESEIFKETTSSKGDNNNLDEENTISSYNNRIQAFGRNRINVEALGIAALGPAFISYERLNETGKLGFEIPFNVHYDATGVTGYSSGFSLKFYPAGQGKWFYIGPSIFVGAFKYYYYDDWWGYDDDFTFAINPGAKIGVQFPVGRVFGLSIGGTAGYVLPFESGIDGAFSYSANLGFNFSF